MRRFLLATVLLLPLTRAFAAEGDEIWQTSFSGGGAFNAATTIAVDKMDSIIVGGYVTDAYSPSHSSIWIAKYSSSHVLI